MVMLFIYLSLQNPDHMGDTAAQVSRKICSIWSDLKILFSVNAEADHIFAIKIRLQFGCHGNMYEPFHHTQTVC
jgi:hypothetical protein